MIAWVVQRNKEVGLIPCESEAERQEMYDLWNIRHPGGASEQLPALVLPPVGQHWIVDESELPGGSISAENDYFFDCWEWDGSCKVNMPKARGIQMNKIREVRDKELANLDVPFMKALEDGDTDVQTTIKSKKQELRDIPQTFDLTTDTADELKQKWPEGLPKE
jgi:hypothetical protein